MSLISSEVQTNVGECPPNVEFLYLLQGNEPRGSSVQDEVNIEASELVGQIHDGLKELGYPSGCLENLLVRTVFCLFADDTGIFQPRELFHNFLLDRTKEDASDTGVWLNRIFEILNTQENRKQRNLDEELALFPYLDGGLFNDTLATADFDSKLRTRLLEACEFDWSEISPVIFGSLFQSVMDRDKRRVIGAHYTTEQNILKVIEPLFLDELRSEFKRICGFKRNRTFRLKKFQEMLRAVHRKLDLAIERLYRKTPFQSDRDRIEFLFGRYQSLVQPLLIKKRGYKSFGRMTPPRRQSMV